MNDYNQDVRKDWRRRLHIRRNEHGSYVVGHSQRHAKFIGGVGSVLHGAGYRYAKNAKTFPGEPHFYLKKHSAVIFVCDCTYTGYGIEHDCPTLFHKTSGTLAAVEEDSRLLDLVVGAVEKLGCRVDVVFKCQTADRETLRRRLVAFIEGKETFTQRDRLAWLFRYGNLNELGVGEDTPKFFLLPAVVSDRGRADRQQVFLGQLGGNHAAVFSSIPSGIVEQFGRVDFGFMDHSGAFLSRETATAYAERHGLIGHRMAGDLRELIAGELGAHTV